MTDHFFRADLHSHSTASDGSLSPQGVVERALARGLQALALTDHDTVAGVMPAYVRAQELGLQLLSGTELSSAYYTTTVHILGYGINPDDESLQAFLQDQVQARSQRNVMILEKLQARGMAVDPTVLEQIRGVVGRVHIAQALVKYGYVRTISEAFQLWIGDRAPCYVAGAKPLPSLCIEKIRQSGGKAFLAHPHLMDRREVLRLLKDFSWDGIEVFYASMPAKNTQDWASIAQSRQLQMSGGSDFHGLEKTINDLGQSWVDQNTWIDIIKGTFWAKHRL